MTYTEEINDNNEYFAVIQPVLGRGETIDADIMALTGWMAGRLINLGWVDELPLDDIPNAANLRDDLVSPAWDPEGLYSLPWQTGLGGIAYNLEATGRELTSTNDLFDPEFNGRIGMLLEMNDTLGLVLLSLGVDISSISSFAEAEEAFAKLEQAKADGQIRAFTGNDYLQDLESGNFAACVGWSGDVAQLSVDNPNVRFVIPEEGGHSWADTMLMPKGAEHRAEAAQWMDFVYDPVQAAQLTALLQFISPVKGVQEEVAKIDPELAENPLVFPDEAMLANVYDFAYLDDETQAQFDEAWSARRWRLGPRRSDRGGTRDDDNHRRPRSSSVRVRSGRYDRIGLAVVLFAGALLVLLGARLVTGPVAVVVSALLLVTIVGYIVVAITGGPEARRRLAPYGLLQPGIFWLALFYLAPLFTLLRTSLSTLPSRFAVEAEFDWAWSNYADALTDFGVQFQHSFVYSGAATVLCLAIGYPMAYVIAFRGGRWKNLLLGLVVVPFFTSYLIRTIAWQSLLADSGPIIGALERLRLTGPLESLGIMDNGRLLDTRAAVIGGLTYNFLPFMVLPIYVSLEKINTSPRRRRQGPLLVVGSGLPQGRPATVRSQAFSPGRCSRSSPPPATSSTPSISATRTRR